MPKISVCVPIYKVEPYIERCVRSLMEQTMHDLEFIFVNDCTPDRSMEILRSVIAEYPGRQNQIHIVEHEQNLGLVQTRKDAFAVATGDYIACCDSDDWVEPNMYEEMYKATNHGSNDIVMCGHARHSQEGVQQCHPHIKPTPQDYLKSTLRHWNYLWNKMIRAELIKTHYNDFIPVPFMEDFFACCHIFYYAQSIGFADAALYHYDRSNAFSTCNNLKISKDDLPVYEQNFRLLESLWCRGRSKWKYAVGINYRKFCLKQHIAMPGSYDFFHVFRESSWYIPFFKDTPLGARLKTFVVNNCYPLYCQHWKKCG